MIIFLPIFYKRLISIYFHSEYNNPYTQQPLESQNTRRIRNDIISIITQTKGDSIQSPSSYWNDEVSFMMIDIQTYKINKVKNMIKTDIENMIIEIKG